MSTKPSRRRGALLRVLLLTAISVVAPRAGQSAPLYSAHTRVHVSYEYDCGIQGAKCSDQISTRQDSETTALEDQASLTYVRPESPLLRADLLSAARVSSGRLGVYGYVEEGSHIEATARAEAWFTDTLTVESSTLAAGSPVSLLFSYTLDSTIVLDVPFTFGQCDTLGYAQGGVSINSPQQVLRLVHEERHGCPSPPPDRHALYEMSTFVGDTIALRYSLSASTRPFYFSTVEVDAMHTAQLYIESLTVGATARAASGLMYQRTATQVAEPSGAVLLLLGGLLTWSRACWRRW